MEIPGKLTTTERKLLDVLRASKRPVPPQLISEALWPGERFQPTGIRVLVSRLRRKLGADVIVTVGGHGYLLAEDLEPCAHCNGLGLVRKPPSSSTDESPAELARFEVLLPDRGWDAPDGHAA